MDTVKFFETLDKFLEKLGLQKASFFARGVALMVSGMLLLLVFVQVLELQAYRFSILAGGSLVLFVGVAILIIMVNKQEERERQKLEEEKKRQELEQHQQALEHKMRLEDLHPFFSTDEVHKAQQFYIETYGQNVAPSRDEEPNAHHAFAAREPLIPYFLERAFPYRTKSLTTSPDTYRFYLILADSGMGKTTFMLNLFLRYHASQKAGKFSIKLFPFGHPDSYTEIQQLVTKGNHKDTILLLDAFDEDLETSKKGYKARLDEWISLVQGFREVIITSRTQFFPDEKSTQGTLKVKRADPNRPGWHTFKVMYLSPFTDQEIQAYLLKKFPDDTPTDQENRRRAEAIVSKTPKLMVRPMLLANIDLFLAEKDRIYHNATSIYKTLIKQWIDREAGRKYEHQDRFKQELWRFSEKMACTLYEKWQQKEELQIPRVELTSFMDQLDFQLTEKETTSESLLNRDAEGNIKFSHKSILEYFLAQHIQRHPHTLGNYQLQGFDMLQLFLKEACLLMDMVVVEGGTFDMGKDYKVSLSPYQIGKYPITQSQWQEIMGSNPAHFQGDLNRPVEQVSWDDCQLFIQKLNQKYGLTYRLPTEAEWEFAARGGKLSQGYEYAGSDQLDEVGWFDDNSGGASHPVGQKLPNELGIYDLSGNVWEWCKDWHGGYPSGEYTNPTGPPTGSYRVLRGGSWFNTALYCRVAYRDDSGPSYRDYDIGLRLARSL